MLESWRPPSSLPTLSLLDTTSLSFEATPRWPVFRVMEILSQECNGRLSKSYSSPKNLKMRKKCLHEYWDFFHCSHVHLVSPNLIPWKRLCSNELRTDKTPFIMTTHGKAHSLELPELNFGLDNAWWNAAAGYAGMMVLSSSTSCTCCSAADYALGTFDDSQRDVPVNWHHRDSIYGLIQQEW